MGDSEPGSVRVTPIVLHVLLSLAGADAHAYGIMKDIGDRTGGRLSVGPGSLHYTLTRLLSTRLIEEVDASPADAPDDARRKYFRMTGAGRRVLESELSVWADVVEIARARRLIPGREGA
jgi:DNA-binding PadR family transcriptional regulator